MKEVKTFNSRPYSLKDKKAELETGQISEKNSDVAEILLELSD